MAPTTRSRGSATKAEASPPLIPLSSTGSISESSRAVVDSDLKEDEQPAQKKRKGRSSAQGKPPAKRSKLGKLSLFMDMPLDILFEIIHHLPPETLVSLARVNSIFRSTLSAPDAVAVWASKRVQVEAPVPFPGFSERKWMQILFAAPICEVCGARNIQTVDMYMRQRICRKCVQDTSRAVTVHQYRVANPNLELPKFTLICSLVLPTRCSPTHGWSRTKFVEYYPVAELNKVRDEVEASHNADEYIAQRRTSVEELRVRIRAYEIWVKGYRAAVAKQKDMEKKAPIEARREAIKRRMVQLGFTEEEYKHVRELPAVAKKTPLYEEDWSIVEPIVTLAIVRIRLRAASTFRLLEVLYAEIKLSLRPIEYRAYPLLANIVDISALPSDFPSLYQLGLGPSISKPVVDAIRDEFLADLQRFARTKKERIRKHIVREADTLLGADNEGELPLEETLFAACKEGWVVSGIAEVSGVDPMTTTPDAMDEKGLLFRYKRPSATWDPSTCVVGSWRKALAHFRHYQDAHVLEMKTVCEVIRKEEVNEDEKDEWGWSCNQCHVNLGNLAARRDVVDHLRETHGISEPRVPDDHFYAGADRLMGNV